MAKTTTNYPRRPHLSDASINKTVENAQSGFKTFFDECMSAEEKTLSEVLDDAVVVVTSTQVKAGSRASLATFVEALEAKEQLYSCLSFEAGYTVTLDDIRAIFFAEPLYESQHLSMMKLMTTLAICDVVEVKAGTAVHASLKEKVFDCMHAIQVVMYVYFQTLRHPR